ncbi:NACHT domain-containing protein [Streptomyces harbinensis]|uniref:NACHT N-terminal Helical domain 1-containing protein n=1 Tax=Streptomyces harbinensis TaxID=1176198 RepID=UPI00158F9EAA|nr:NACHT domain-containing protein [Streptomyces harbinensis]QKV68861.1 NACHT domain-containing protein [Streptomyces harbinensis]
MLGETAALRLGTAVANAAGRWWLGNARQEQERSLPMEELIRLRMPGIRLQREVKQQFEHITNAVFDRLEPHLKHAFERMDEGSRTAVVLAVSDALGQADLSDEALLADNVHPPEVIRRITGSVTGPVGFNDAETRLYQLLMAECVEYYVHIVRSLPVFEERAAAELLTRTAALGSEIARILERLPDRSLFAPDGTDQDAAFRRTYLELLSRDLDEVELFRSPSDRTSPPRVRLSVAYVSLRASGDDGTRPRSTRYLPPLRPDMSNWEEAGAERGGGSGMRVETALRDASRVLLRGEAGSGKTTLLRWLAITAARGAFTGQLDDWNGLTPILIKLREYSGRALPKPDGMLDGAAGHITGVMPRGWVERQLGTGRVLLLIDGVDELLDRERRPVREWLRRLLSQYEGIRVVVTSRPAAAGADWLRRENFAPLHLDRMTPPDLAAFVRQWHQAVRELGTELPCTEEELPRYEQSLLTSLKDRAHLQSLAGTPLLAAMLCGMHLHRGRRLPRDRMELYRNALHTLVHDRDSDRNVPSAVDSKLGLRDKLLLLRDLAWRLSDNNRTEIDLKRAAEHVTVKLRSMRHLDELAGADVLEQLRHRSGVLRSPAEGRLDFVHRTFQEYLAAKEATEEDRIGNLISRAHLDLWRETIIMAAGHANTSQREELLHGILDRAAEEPRHARTLRLLAASCQETLPSVSDALADRLDETVSRLLPARRMTDPPALAAVGPSLLRWLPRSLEELTEKAAIQTVRTIALIGGEKSLELLAGYVGDQRGKVVDELIQAWAYFDAEAYATAVLSSLPLGDHAVWIKHTGQLRTASRLRSITSLHIECPVNGLDFLGDFPPLRGVWIENTRGDFDLTPLRFHPTLESVMIFSGEATGTSTLADIPELAMLALNLHDQADLRVLLRLPKLKFASLGGITGRTNLSPLANLTELIHLHLIGNDRNISPEFNELGRMANLMGLNLYAYDVNSWLAELKSTPPSLSYLGVCDCVLPSDPNAFAGLRNLTELNITDCFTLDGTPVTTLNIPGVHVRIHSNA